MVRADLRILVIDQDRLRASILEDGLREAGHARVTVIAVMDGLIDRIRDLSPDVVVIDLANPNRDMLEFLLNATDTTRRPVAMFVDRSDPAMTEAAIDAGVSAYIVDGLKKERVKPILDMTISRFNAVSRLRKELEATRTELAERKIIDRAKGILMHSRGMTEDESYRLLRKTAMDQNRRVVDVADSLITAAGLLGDRKEG